MLFLGITSTAVLLLGVSAVLVLEHYWRLGDTLRLFTAFSVDTFCSISYLHLQSMPFYTICSWKACLPFLAVVLCLHSVEVGGSGAYRSSFLLEVLCRQGLPVLCRPPVIPGVSLEPWRMVGATWALCLHSVSHLPGILPHPGILSPGSYTPAVLGDVEFLLFYCCFCRFCVRRLDIPFCVLRSCAVDSAFSSPAFSGLFRFVLHVDVLFVLGSFWLRLSASFYVADLTVFGHSRLFHLFCCTARSAAFRFYSPFVTACVRLFDFCSLPFVFTSLRSVVRSHLRSILRSASFSFYYYCSWVTFFLSFFIPFDFRCSVESVLEILRPVRSYHLSFCSTLRSHDFVLFILRFLLRFIHSISIFVHVPIPPLLEVRFVLRFPGVSGVLVVGLFPVCSHSPFLSIRFHFVISVAGCRCSVFTFPGIHDFRSFGICSFAFHSPVHFVLVHLRSTCCSTRPRSPTGPRSHDWANFLISCSVSISVFVRFLISLRFTTFCLRCLVFRCSSTWW